MTEEEVKQDTRTVEQIIDDMYFSELAKGVKQLRSMQNSMRKEKRKA